MIGGNAVAEALRVRACATAPVDGVHRHSARKESQVQASEMQQAASLADGVRTGQPRAIARSISAIEQDTDLGRAVVGALADSFGRAHRIGITGPPGAGKSSLVGALIDVLARAGARVGVVAVDPSSRCTGGAILGDRLRMERHANGHDVFVRSLGSRGDAGGLSLAAIGAADVLDAAGYDPVIVETVGAGQDEVEVGEMVHTRIVVLPPGLGDEVQAVKAGVMEIADLFVISKCDLPGADLLQQHLLSVLRLRRPESRPPVIATSTVSGRGIAELVDALAARAHVRPPDIAQSALARLIVRRALRTAEQALQALPPHFLRDLCERMKRGEITLAGAASEAIRNADL
jgi:LAO/AO transport system kinase